MSEALISSIRVDEIFRDCLYSDEEIQSKGEALIKEEAITAQGILSLFGFNPVRLESYRDEVSSILDQLPDKFKTTGGGGASFLEACCDKEGNLWGQHQDMEQLFSLGIALNLVQYPLPKDLWSVLPGGMPYVTILE